MKRSKIIAAILLIGSFIAIIFLLTLSSRPYISVSQITANPSDYNNQEVEVIGTVSDFNGGDFNLTENSERIVIQVSSITIPDDVENGIQVVVKGIWHSDDFALKASQILTQCS